MKIVVWGTGSIGTRHLGILSRMETEVVVLPVRSERAQALAAEGFSVARSLDEAFSMKPDGFVIATDTARHAADIDQVLAAGCSVLVEKPLAVSAAEIAHLRHRKDVHVACCMRFDKGLELVKTHLPALGKPLVIDAECLSWLPDWRPGRAFLDGYAARPDGGGGVLLDLIHEIDYLGWLFGWPQAVTGRLENQGILGFPREVEESVTALLDWGGFSCTLRLSYVVRPTVRRLRVFCEGGTIEWDHAQKSLRIERAGVVLAETRGWLRETMYEKMDAAWLAALRQEPGQLSDEPGGALATAEEGYQALAVCDAIRQAHVARTWLAPGRAIGAT